MTLLNRALFAALDAFAADQQIPSGDWSKITIELPKDPAHGDISTNAPLLLARAARCKPQELGACLIEKLWTDPELSPYLLRVEIAGPGFLNATFKPIYWHKRLHEILEQGVKFGSSSLGQGELINLEYVSANPTGPLHAGHGRVAIVADVLANLLEKVGYRILREYYVNDAGAQTDKLASSLYLRYQEALGKSIPEIPAGYYPGDYLKDVAQALIAQESTKGQWLGKPKKIWKAFFREFAVRFLMEEIKASLSDVGITHDVFTSELTLHNTGAIEQAVQLLREKGLVYEGTLPPPKGSEG